MLLLNSSACVFACELPVYSEEHIGIKSLIERELMTPMSTKHYVSLHKGTIIIIIIITLLRTLCTSFQPLQNLLSRDSYILSQPSHSRRHP